MAVLRRQAKLLFCGELIQSQRNRPGRTTGNSHRRQRPGSPYRNPSSRQTPPWWRADFAFHPCQSLGMRAVAEVVPIGVRIYSIGTVDARVKPMWHHQSVFAPFQIALRLLTDLIAEWTSQDSVDTSPPSPCGFEILGRDAIRR
jgi:hypothetical protein